MGCDFMVEEVMPPQVLVSRQQRGMSINSRTSAGRQKIFSVSKEMNKAAFQRDRGLGQIHEEGSQGQHNKHS